MKRIMAWLAVSVMLLCGVAGASAEDGKPSYVLAGFDSTQYRVWSDNTFFAAMEEMTGIHFELKQYTTAAAWNAAKASYAAGGELPDVLFKAQLTGYECAEMLDKGVLVDLKPYLERCCPHLWALIKEDGGILDAITLPDGRIAALPYICRTATQNVMWINKKFLAKAGKNAPSTWEELVDVLRAFKNLDCNGNGNPDDEIPLGFLGPYDLKYLGHAFGLIANDYNIFLDGEGRVRYMPTEEGFADFIGELRALYKEGLLDKDGFTTADTIRSVTDAKAAQRYGVIFAPMVTTLMPSEWVPDYACLMPLTYEGVGRYRDVGLGVIRGTFAVTSHCANVEEVLSWADLLYTEEGSVLASVGRRGVDYVVDGDGTWRLTDSTRSNSYYTISGTITSGADIPGYSAEDFQARYSDSGLGGMLDALREFNSKCVMPIPFLYMTRSDSDRINELQASLGRIVDLQIARWVLGEEEITPESRDAFEKALKDAGLEEFIDTWQRISDSQEGN